MAGYGTPRGVPDGGTRDGQVAIRKAVFPSGGLGTRMLPATKSQPKEMLNVVDRPLIQYGVEEAVASGLDQVILVTVDPHQPDRRAIIGRLLVAQSQSPRPSPTRGGALLQVGDPPPSTIRPLYPGYEARHDSLKLGQDHLAVAPGLGEGMSQQMQDQLFVALAGGEDPHVRQRAGREKPPQQIECLGLDGPGVGCRRLRGLAGKLSLGPDDHLR